MTHGDAGRVATGAGTGAVYGATAGSVFGPVGTGVGAGVGAVGGGLYGYLKNKSLMDLLSGSQTPVGTILEGPQNAVNAEQSLVNTAANWGTTGNGPSAAQAMLANQRAGINQQTLGQAKSMAGGNPALQATLASNSAAAQQQGALNQSTQLRAQEQQAALSAALSGQNQVAQNSLGISDQHIKGDQENNKRTAGFLGGLTGGITGGLGKLMG